VTHVPWLKARHGIGDGRLGLVLLAMAVGAVVALPIAGWLVARFGSRAMTVAAALGFCLAVPLPVLAPTAGLAALGLAVLGACNGLLDVSMNAEGVMIEQAQGRPIMSSLHGLFSLGGVAGAALAAGAMRAGLGPIGHLGAIAGAGIAVVALAARGLPVPPAGHRAPAEPVLARPTGALLGLGVLTFCALLAEGAMGDWSAVYLHDALGASPARAAAGFAAFSLAMAAGRFSGDALAARLGPVRLLRASGVVAACGLGAALLVRTPEAAIAGFGLVGVGIANAIPLIFSAAGRVPGVRPGTGLAAVASTGYLGFLAGPPAIGLVAEAASLDAALGLVCVACAIIGAGAATLARATASPAPDEAAATR
jgi:predicted MFS family arabinose efflux permease